MTDPVEQICLRAQAGDLAAASELVALYYERIFSYFRRLCGREEDAADLTQKTFFKVWVSIASYAGRSSFSTWIHGIAHHVYVDWRRKADRLDFPENEWWEACASEESGPFEDAAEKDQAHQLYAMVERLDEESKQAVHLHYYQGLSLRETAEALGIAISTVKYRLRGALDSLRSATAEPKFRTR
jgi:RNA polymerase sigma-70 factor (ECF subfamily)